MKNLLILIIVILSFQCIAKSSLKGLEDLATNEIDELCAIEMQRASFIYSISNDNLKMNELKKREPNNIYVKFFENYKCKISTKNLCKFDKHYKAFKLVKKRCENF